MSKGHSKYGSKIPFMSNLKKPACASKQNLLELAIYIKSGKQICLKLYKWIFTEEQLHAAGSFKQKKGITFQN